MEHCLSGQTQRPAAPQLRFQTGICIQRIVRRVSCLEKSCKRLK